ncbi:MAG: response regulator [Verrucomicrobiota bacterium]|jgi:CheY-like chemotaxis protein
MKKILIVENDPILRGIYRRKFDLSGFVVEAVDDGPVALDTLPAFKPNLIQMDLTLPSMNGTELIRRIRAMPNFKIVPIVVLSSFYRPDLIKEAFDAGANKCVSKMDCTPNLALEIVEQIFSGEIIGLYPQPLGNSPIPVSMPPPKPAATVPMPAPVAAPPPPPPDSPVPSPLSTPPAPSSLPRLVVPPSPPKFGGSAHAPAAPEKIPFTAPLIKMPPPAPPAATPGIPAPTPTPVFSGVRVPVAPKFSTASPAAAPPPPKAPEPAAPEEESPEPAAPDFGSDATSTFRLEIRQEFLKRVPQIQMDLRERVGALVRSKSTTEQLTLLQGFSTSISSLVGLAGVTGFSRIAHLAGAMEALIKDLQKKPRQMTSSVLRTIAHASDCLNVLFRDINQGAQEIPQSLLILAVDDEPISRRTISVALAKANLRCICLEDPKMAMTILGENQFDLVFLDAEMPEMNGFELCAELRKTVTNKATPVIFVTSLTNFEVRAQSSLAGANDLIAKPFLMMELAVKALTYLLRPKSIVDVKSQPGGN